MRQSKRMQKMPIIPWTGSKRKQAPYIVSKFPKKIRTYYECFLGGGSVMHELLNRIYNGEFECKKIVCSDLNKDLISIWNAFMNDSNALLRYYADHFHQIADKVHLGKDSENNKMLTKEEIERGKEYFYGERERFNNMDEDDEEKPYLLFWMIRNSFANLVRYNKDGKYNSPFAVTQKFGVTPKNLQQVFDSWKVIIDDFLERGNKIEFICKSYDDVVLNAIEGDIVYMDPPYANFGGMYFADKFDNNHMFDVLRELNKKNVRWLLSYDGKTGIDDRTYNVPTDLYLHHEYVESSISAFKLLKSNTVGTSKNDVLRDSLYMNF